MTVPAATPQPAPHYSAPRRLLARHPVATFLVMVFALTYGTALVPFLTQRAILPFGLALWAPLISLFCCAPAFLVLADPRYIVGAGAGTSVQWGVFLELILIIANIGTAVVPYPILRRQNEILALGYVTARIVECTFILVGLLSLLTIVTLRQEATAGAEPSFLETGYPIAEEGQNRADPPRCPCASTCLEGLFSEVRCSTLRSSSPWCGGSNSKPCAGARFFTLGSNLRSVDSLQAVAT